MHRLLLFLTVMGVIALPTVLVGAQATVPQDDRAEDYFGLPLCLPGMPADGTCLMFGPAQTVAEMEAAGFPYPPMDLAAAVPPAELGVLPVFVAKINLPEDESAPIYASFDDAVAGVNAVSQIDPGSLRYISYVNRLDQNGNAFVQLGTGGWLRASPAAYTDFQGLLFFDNPRNDFGWIVDQTPSYRNPGFGAQITGQNYIREDVIQVYNAIESEGVVWFQIAPDEWVNSLKARVISVNAVPPEGVGTNRWIEINLLQQILTVYEDGQLLFATLIASGMEPFYTQPGLFTVNEKKPLETMQGAFEADRSDFYYLQDVPWTMYFDQARALHAAYWRTFFGYPQSHGCVNLSPGDAKWLFEWAEEGDYVWVHDPSGQTPTDKEYYGPGAP
ncbi:MAG: L,D-transpeptidase [Chloroflexota bacterium]|nr:L,D-transpeptidase [Chloroflexota bacterium]